MLNIEYNLHSPNNWSETLNSMILQSSLNVRGAIEINQPQEATHRPPPALDARRTKGGPTVCVTRR